MTVRVGQGLDVHPFATTGEQLPLVLAGVDVPHDRGLEGHSDADVVAHAVIDALLGATARGDIGSRFGTDAPEVEGASSLALLRTVVAEVRDEGWVMGNLDCTVVAEAPRLAPHREPMRENLARATGLELGEVSVKATTADRLGSIGRGEGVACWVVCTVRR